MSKYTLEYEPEYEFELIGISSALPDYKIAWLLNRELSINLTRCKDHTPPNQIRNERVGLALIDDVKTEVSYAIFSYDNFVEEDCYYLVSNRCNKKYLSQDTKGYDYLLRIESMNMDVDDCIQHLKKRKIFNLVKKIDVEEMDLAFLSFLQ